MESTTSTIAPAKGALTSHHDAAIIAAWERRAAAFAELCGQPDPATTGTGTDEQSALWAIIDKAEAEICNAIAITPRGAEIQLWTATTYLFDSAEDEPPCYRADLDYFTEQGERRDWKDRLVIAALRSLAEQSK